MRTFHPASLVALAPALGLQAQAPPGSAPQVEVRPEGRSGPGLAPSPGFASRIGAPLAAVQFRDLQGRSWALADLKGKVVYLNVWFTGCPPCVQEIPDLNAVHTRLGAHPDLVMLSLAFDPEEKVRAFLAAHPIAFPVAAVPFEVLKVLAMQGSSVSFPTHLIVDRQGRLAVASTGGSPRIGTDLEHSLRVVLQ